MTILVSKRCATPGLIDGERKPARLLSHRRSRLVVEQGDRAVGLAASIVLPGKACSRLHLKVAALAAQAPDHRSGLAVDLVDGMSVARTDEQVSVAVDGYRVGMK